VSDRLVNDPDAVAVLAANVADQIGIPALHVEKDFWVTEVLRGVTQAAEGDGVEIVFKGHGGPLLKSSYFSTQLTPQTNRQRQSEVHVTSMTCTNLSAAPRSSPVFTRSV